MEEAFIAGEGGNYSAPDYLSFSPSYSLSRLASHRHFERGAPRLSFFVSVHCNVY